MTKPTFDGCFFVCFFFPGAASTALPLLHFFIAQRGDVRLALHHPHFFFGIFSPLWLIVSCWIGRGDLFPFCFLVLLHLLARRLGTNLNVHRIPSAPGKTAALLSVSRLTSRSSCSCSFYFWISVKYLAAVYSSYLLRTPFSCLV